MALITCPECKRPGVSDSAKACPGCGAKIAKAGGAARTEMTVVGGICFLLGIGIVLLGIVLGPILKLGFALPAAIVIGPALILLGWFNRKEPEPEKPRRHPPVR